MISLIVHGGAWNIPDNLVESHREGCLRALRVGWDILNSGGSAVDAVERAIRELEDDETFDAGRGSHLNALGEVEMDASIMNGSTLRCGAVAAVQHVRNPISLARKVMDSSEHILLAGKGAERFAMEHGVELCRGDELIADRELAAWRDVQRKENYQAKDAFKPARSMADTVGVVALDSIGVVCVGTSTGGTLNKYPGRVGDSPLIGCGSYADSSIGGVSTTGWGESMIKVVMAKTVIDLMDRHGGDPQVAADKGIRLLESKAGGYGGLIVLNPKGQFGVAFNTPRMARAYQNTGMKAPFVDV